MGWQYYSLAMPSLHKKKITWSVDNIFKSIYGHYKLASVYQIRSFLKILNQIPDTSIGSLRGYGETFQCGFKLLEMLSYIPIII